MAGRVMGSPQPARQSGPIPVAREMERDNMQVQVHAPSTPVLAVSLVLAVLALFTYFTVPEMPVGFWLAIMAYVVMGAGTLVKT